MYWVRPSVAFLFLFHGVRVCILSSAWPPPLALQSSTQTLISNTGALELSFLSPAYFCAVAVVLALHLDGYGQNLNHRWNRSGRRSQVLNYCLCYIDDRPPQK
ncbi:hypothetical protein C8R43DRAFT_1027936 [Mycena crocata]|nr:hypothetical protein C8R43DRAFT_1027936 [Mycena crocata]